MSRRHNRCILSETSKLSLLSPDWEWVKLSPKVYLHRKSKMAACQSIDISQSLAAVLYADAEKKMKKSFEKRQLSKDKLL